MRYMLILPLHRVAWADTYLQSDGRMNRVDERYPLFFCDIFCTFCCRSGRLDAFVSLSKLFISCSCIAKMYRSVCEILGFSSHLFVSGKIRKHSVSGCGKRESGNMPTPYHGTTFVLMSWYFSQRESTEHRERAVRSACANDSARPHTTHHTHHTHFFGIQYCSGVELCSDALTSDQCTHNTHTTYLVHSTHYTHTCTHNT